MKRFLAALAAITCLILVPLVASAQVAGSPISTITPQVDYQLQWRHINTTTLGAFTTLPNISSSQVPWDSSYASHAAARVDTTEWLSLFPNAIPWTPAYSPTTAATDSFAVFRLWLGPATGQDVGQSSNPAISTSDSVYVKLQFQEPSGNAISQAITMGYVASPTGTAQMAEWFSTLPTCLYTRVSFFGAKAIRFIVTWPASTTTAYHKGIVTINRLKS